MPRKFYYIGFSFLAGAILSAFFTVKINCCIVVAAFILSAILCFFVNTENKLKLVTLSLSFIIAVLQNVLFTVFEYDKILLYDNREVEFVGEIYNIQNISEQKQIIYCDGEIESQYKTRVKLYIDTSDYVISDEIYIKGTAAKLTDSLKFRDNTFSKSNGVFLQIKDVKRIKLLSSNSTIKKSIISFRHTINENIRATVKGDCGGFLIALLCSDKSMLSDKAIEDMYLSGISHITAVSGTHLVIVSIMFSFVLHLFRIRRKPHTITLIIIIWLFAIFADMSASVVRAAIVLTIIYAARLFNRSADAKNSLGLCAIIMLWGNPYGALSISFLLSFFAAFGVSVVTPMLIKDYSFEHGKKLKVSIITSCSVLFCIFPISVFSFDYVSIISPLSNIIIVPLSSVALLLTLISSLFIPIGFISNVLLYLAGIVSKIILIFSSIFADIPFATISAGSVILRIMTIISTTIFFISIVKIKKKQAIFMSMFISSLLVITSIFCNNLILNKVTSIIILSDRNSLNIMLYNSGKSVIMSMYGFDNIDEVISRYNKLYDINEIEYIISFTDSDEIIDLVDNNITMYSFEPAENESINNIHRFNDEIFGGELNISERTIEYKINDNVFYLSLNRMSYYINDEPYQIDISDSGCAVLIKFDDNISVRRLSNALR